MADEQLRTFATGAVRCADADATRYDLITPIGLKRVAMAYAEGAAKYSDFNWERGMDLTTILNHLLKHVYQYLAGDRSEDHLGHAAWNALAACHSEEMWPHLNTKLRGPGCTPPVSDAKEVERKFTDPRITYPPQGCVQDARNP